MSAVQQVLMAVGTSISLPVSLIANPSATSYNSEFASSGLSLTLTTSGSLFLLYSANGTEKDPDFPVSQENTWLVGGTSSLYSVRLRKTSGSSFDVGSSPVNTWIPITSTQAWYLNSNSNSFQPSNSKAVLGVLEIAFSNNLTNILAQSDISFSTFALTQGGFQP
jgi:hypothetical protein